MDNNQVTIKKPQGSLQRELGFWSLVAFGVIFMSPTSALVYYPTIQPWSGGYTWISFAIATLLMCITVASYQLMVEKFPQAGSAYTYASKGINGKVGFVVGWVLLIDYVLVPMFVMALTSLYLTDIFPVIPAWGFILFFAIFTTTMSCLGVKISIIVEIIIGIYLVLLVIFFDFSCIKDMFLNQKPLFIADAIYNSDKVIWSGVFQGASLGILAFVGFDGITTLAEETKISAKKVGHSCMVAVIVIGILYVTSTYLANAAMEWTTIPEEELPTTYRYMFSIFYNEYFSGLLVTLQKVGVLALCIAAITAASRILFSMGRNGVISMAFFGYIHPKFNTPVYATIMVGALALVGALSLPWYTIAEIVSFGACVGFISVNISVIAYFWVKQKDKKALRNLILPAIAALGILYVITTQSTVCLTVGISWTIVGIIYLLVRYNRSEAFKTAVDKGDLEL